ncbi:response regulator receiver protein [Sediminispirochaeta smaragdinae DSM 11293]|uniref:Response regulator receiver protein n=2 Tax=Sediminispirochaeta TaxID=1911556 RepID=E1R9B6_SEDSS|nr:response regulator receiver protein [Sediminispirochaeta smaragdinae DSM 11293]
MINSVMIVKTIICDDDPMVLALLKAYLSPLKMLDIQTVDSAPKALEIIKHEKIHLLILDIVMPTMDGITLLREAKKIDPLTHVVMMTSDATLGRVIDSLGSGALDFVMKPFQDEHDIVEIVEGSVARWERWNKVLKETARKTYEAGDHA